MLRFSLFLVSVCLMPYVVLAQQSTVLTDNTERISGYCNAASRKLSDLRLNIEKQSLKYLHRLQKQEEKLFKQLQKKDSSAAEKLFGNLSTRYSKLSNSVKNASADTLPNIKLKEYLPHFDTLYSSFNFLQSQQPNNQQIKAALVNAKQFAATLQKANEIKRLIRERKNQLQQQLQQYGMGKQLKQMKKEIYYYQQQLNEYKELLKNTRQLEAKAIAALKESNLFKDFMKQNSLLASLFRLPNNYYSSTSQAGLQTQAGLNNLLSQRMGNFTSTVSRGNPIQQQFSQAQNQLQQLRKKINGLGSNSSSTEIPDFKPNSQRTKSFWKRMEYGLNVQTQKSRYLLPVTSDIALTAGYKLNDKSVIGIGLGYKMGWGKSIKNISITHEGLSVRSFVDVQIKGNWWLSGGYEQHFNQRFKDYADLNNKSMWQQSGLLGLTKKIKLGKRTNQVQLLWDFLSYQQIPRTEPLKFRFEYKL